MWVGKEISESCKWLKTHLWASSEASRKISNMPNYNLHPTYVRWGIEVSILPIAQQGSIYNTALRTPVGKTALERPWKCHSNTKSFRKAQRLKKKKIQALKSTGARSMLFSIPLYNQKLTLFFQCKDIAKVILAFLIIVIWKSYIEEGNCKHTASLY